MKKKEWVYREILYRVFEKDMHFFSQRSVKDACMISAGMVNKALEPLEQMNAIEKKPMGFHVINPKKILLYWASIRNLKRDIVFQTRVEMPVHEIEKLMPQVKFTAFSGFKFAFRYVPSDYSEVLVYGNSELIKQRFGEKEGIPNIIVLKSDMHLEKFKQTPLAQIFVDLWNLEKWYAEDFIKSLEKELKI